MICNMCFEDKSKEDFYVDYNNKLRLECKRCSQFLTKNVKRNLKKFDIQIKSNTNIELKIGCKYTIIPRTKRVRKRKFVGILKKIYPEYILFESEQGYYENFQKTAFIDDYVIRESKIDKKEKTYEQCNFNRKIN